MVDSFIDLKFFRNVIGGLSVLVLLFIPADGLLMHLNNQTELTQSPIQLKQIADNLIEPLSNYENVFKGNGLLGFYESKTGSAAPKVSINELTKDYRLKGIISGDAPEAILEDARTQKSIFAKKGEQLGDLQVKDIRATGVILSSGAEEKELHMEGA